MVKEPTIIKAYEYRPGEGAEDMEDAAIQRQRVSEVDNLSGNSGSNGRPVGKYSVKLTWEYPRELRPLDIAIITKKLAGLLGEMLTKEDIYYEPIKTESLNIETSVHRVA